MVIKYIYLYMYIYFEGIVNLDSNVVVVKIKLKV